MTNPNTLMEIITTSNDIWQIPFVDVKHLKRRSHLKGHYLPTSDTKVMINIIMKSRLFSRKPGNKGKRQCGVSSVSADVHDVARFVRKKLLINKI